jgi:SAM-dependent methyltransferase
MLKFVKKIIRFLFSRYTASPTELTFDKHADFVNKLFGEESANFTVFELPATLSERLNALYDKQRCDGNMSTPDEMCRTNYPRKFSQPLATKVVKTLCESNYFYRSFNVLTSEVSELGELLDFVQKKTQASISAPVVAVGLRAWDTAPSSSTFGPSATHRDGFPEGHLKALVYTQPMTAANGSIEVEGQVLFSEKPQVVVLKNSNVDHRGIPGKTFSRRLIEITLMRVPYHPTYDEFVRFALPHAPLDRHLKSPSSLYEEFDPVFVSIGSGMNVSNSWLNLDEIDHPAITKIRFDTECKFPIENGKACLAYNSHNLEHLDFEVGRKVLKEASRVLSDHSRLLLKLPDYENILNAYRRNDIDFFTRNNFFDTSPLKKCWKNNDVEFCLENIVSMMFCGYWNDAYGDHFSKRISTDKAAYHGPAKISLEDTRRILELDSPSEIASSLRSIVEEAIDFKSYNHQTAWSRGELITFVTEAAPFELVSTDTEQILADFSFVPEINDSMKHWSMYLEFAKVRKL